MTALASYIGVRAVQLKVGLCIVIKQPQVPGNRVVTGFAVALKNAVVIVVFPVAVNTGVAGIREELRFMAVVTLNVRVFTEQRKSRQVVIEKCGIRPVIFCMAVIALFTKETVMRFVLEMAGHAVSPRGRRENWLFMAVIAGDCLMRSAQKEVGCQVVIESGLFPCLAGVAIATFGAAMSRVTVVFQMTTGARHIHHIIKRIFSVTIGA